MFLYSIRNKKRIFLSILTYQIQTRRIEKFQDFAISIVRYLDEPRQTQMFHDPKV